MIADINDASAKFDLYLAGVATNPAINISVELVGYYAASSTSGGFTPAAGREYDSSTSSGAIAPGATRTVTLPNRVANASAAALNFTASYTARNTDSNIPRYAGTVSAWADDQARPATHILDLSTVPTIPIGISFASNFAVVKLGADGGINIYNGTSGSIKVTVDLEGWYTSTPLPITIDAQGWIHYNSVSAEAATLVNPSTVTQTGTVDSGGACDFSTAGTPVALNAPDGVADESAYNPATCKRMLLVGSLPRGSTSATTGSRPAAVSPPQLTCCVAAFEKNFVRRSARPYYCLPHRK